MNSDPGRAIGADPRPLIGEPLPLDLLNSRWIDESGEHDLLEYPGGVGIWLSSAGLADTAPHNQETLDALLATRTALAALLDGKADSAQAVDGLNETLRHGRLRRRLGPEGPETVIDTDSPSWLPAWKAADAYLRLLEENPGRIRKCANSECVLHFYDISKSGGRRWCSMAVCGNRTKARRHYTRHKRSAPVPDADR
ncbi:CGNR zinc finger domain-containing protein [Streptomyces sp. R39]|uniref:CGNR zinc finger domain-containing protein n=1 Tax=Streptomyces sp. R39 TaxID=3238631 RepID=A0AB39QT73_9ACTN